MLRHPPLAAVALTMLLALTSSVLAVQAFHKGKVVSAGDGKIAIIDQDGENEEFAVAKDCKITLNGKPAELKDVGAGSTVTISTKKDDGKEVAVAIEAKAEE